MKFVLQRVLSAQVEVEGEIVGKIDKGYLLLVGVVEDDTKDIADKMIEKVARLRIFECLFLNGADVFVVPVCYGHGVLSCKWIFAL